MEPPPVYATDQQAGSPLDLESPAQLCPSPEQRYQTAIREREHLVAQNEKLLRELQNIENEIRQFDVKIQQTESDIEMLNRRISQLKRVNHLDIEIAYNSFMKSCDTVVKLRVQHDDLSTRMENMSLIIEKVKLCFPDYKNVENKEIIAFCEKIPEITSEIMDDLGNFYAFTTVFMDVRVRKNRAVNELSISFEKWEKLVLRINDECNDVRAVTSDDLCLLVREKKYNSEEELRLKRAIYERDRFANLEKEIELKRIKDQIAVVTQNLTAIDTEIQSARWQLGDFRATYSL